jgi:beta-galactosidase
VTLAGMPKDIYYLFQAFLNPHKPALHLCGRHHFFRRFAPDNGIKVYANSPTVELFINGVSQGRKKDGDYGLPAMTMTRKGVATPIPPAPRINHVFFWKSELAPGRNVVEVSDGAGHSDRMVVYQKPANGPMPADH